MGRRSQRHDAERRAAGRPQYRPDRPYQNVDLALSRRFTRGTDGDRGAGRSVQRLQHRRTSMNTSARCLTALRAAGVGVSEPADAARGDREILMVRRRRPYGAASRLRDPDRAVRLHRVRSSAAAARRPTPTPTPPTPDAGSPIPTRRRRRRRRLRRSSSAPVTSAGTTQTGGQE